MTADEKQRLLSALQHLLGEFCEGYIVCVEVKDSEDDTTTMHTWGGGYNRALGLALRTVRRMEDADREENSRPPDDGEEWKCV